MATSEVSDLLIGLVVLVWILSRQLQARPAKADVRLPLVLAVIGVIQLIQFLHNGARHGTLVFAALFGSLLLAAVFGGIRAATVHVWVDNGQAWRQGNILTAVLWIVSLGVHLGYDYVVDGKGANAGLGTATLLLYFAVTYAIQRFIVQARAQKIGAAQRLDSGTHMTVHWP